MYDIIITIMFVILAVFFVKAITDRTTAYAFVKERVTDNCVVNVIPSNMLNREGRLVKCLIIYYDPVMEYSWECIKNNKEFDILECLESDEFLDTMRNAYQNVVNRIINMCVDSKVFGDEDIVRFIVVNTSDLGFMGESNISIRTEDDLISDVKIASVGNLTSMEDIMNMAFFYSDKYDTQIIYEDEDGTNVSKNYKED